MATPSWINSNSLEIERFQLEMGDERLYSILTRCLMGQLISAEKAGEVDRTCEK